MNLRRQLLLVSLLTLLLPWAGCEFIRETESALRAGQQQMLAGTARAIAESLQQYGRQFPRPETRPEYRIGDRLYGHSLPRAPLIDGYVNDWPLPAGSLESLRGADGPISYVLGVHEGQLYLYLRVTDRNVVYSQRSGAALGGRPPFADRVSLISMTPGTFDERLEFVAEAPGLIVAYRRTAFGIAPAPTVRAVWQDVAGGYMLEARVPRSILGTHLGIVISNVSDSQSAPVRSSSYGARAPGRFATIRPDLQAIARDLVQPGMRLLVTDAEGFRISNVGALQRGLPPAGDPVATWLRFAYDALVEQGTDAVFAEPDPDGREQQPYIRDALAGDRSAAWFRSSGSGTAVVAVAEPVVFDGRTVGAIVLQQGTDEILSLTNEGLARLLNVTLVSTLFVAAVLLGYATWLSRRIRRLSVAAGEALDGERLPRQLPSHRAGDELGDLSRSFSSVLRKLGEYNEYLRSLAAKLSHELRTPLAIVSSSLDNLEQERLSEASADYTARAKDGAERLKKILAAMSEANRVEELIRHAEPEQVDLAQVLEQALAAYADIYPDRTFGLAVREKPLTIVAAPELLVQMLDKLIDNAVDFSAAGDEIRVTVDSDPGGVDIAVDNPGPPLPETMRSQLFDSMVSVRGSTDDRHLGLGLYVARVIAEGHGGTVRADNIDGGVRFSVRLRRDYPA